MNSETFISFSVEYKVEEYKTKDGEARNKYLELRFLDSLCFINSSLYVLVKNLTDHPILESKFEDNQLSKKGVFPYEYLDNFAKLKETKPPKHEDFYSTLSLESVTEEQCKHAVKVFKHHDCKTNEDYLILYLKTDVLYLSDTFETFSKNLSQTILLFRGKRTLDIKAKTKAKTALNSINFIAIFRLILDSSSGSEKQLGQLLMNLNADNDTKGYWNPID